MSSIDQAFINAYSEYSQSSVQGVPRAEQGHPRTGEVRSARPELRIFAHAVDRGPKEVRTDHAESPPAHAPHFSNTRDSAYTVPAPPQGELDVSEDEIVLPSLVGDRKPLSSFSAPREVHGTAFKPEFEVDEFRWPTVIDDLLQRARGLLLPVVSALTHAARDGRSLLGVTGTARGAGATTVVMCLSRLLAEQGHSVALVDANFTNGQLATLLGLEFDFGWNNVLAGELPLAECAVHSLRDDLTVIPLGRTSETGNARVESIQSAVIAGMLRYHHDLVLFDLGSMSDSRQHGIIQSIVNQCRLDFAIAVAPTGTHGVGTLHAIDQIMSLFGPQFLGVIGNRSS